jgi:hypothetical protein
MSGPPLPGAPEAVPLNGPMTWESRAVGTDAMLAQSLRGSLVSGAWVEWGIGAEEPSLAWAGRLAHAHPAVVPALSEALQTLALAGADGAEAVVVLLTRGRPCPGLAPLAAALRAALPPGGPGDALRAARGGPR